MSKQRYFQLLTALWLILAAGCATTASPEPTVAPGSGAINNPATVTPDIPASTPVEAPAAPAGNLVGSDPASGQSAEVDMSWEQLCLSSQYQVQIAKDPDFSIIVIDTGAFTPADPTAPAAYYPAGGQAASPSALTLWSRLEAGHTYYWRARVVQTATGQKMRSPWSEVKSFTVKAGLSTTSPSCGLQAIYPLNMSTGVPVKSVAFSWSPLPDITKYRFVLAKDATMTQIVADAVVTTTAYEYQGTLDYSTSYFWRVIALEPVPSDWSATFTFQTQAPPPPPPAEPEAAETPLWVWVVTALGALLIIAIIVLIFKVRRR